MEDDLADGEFAEQALELWQKRAEILVTPLLLTAKDGEIEERR